MQDKFRLDLSDEEAVHYMQSLIDESVGALFAAVVEQIHKFAQVLGRKHTTYLNNPLGIDLLIDLLHISGMGLIGLEQVSSPVDLNSLIKLLPFNYEKKKTFGVLL